MSDKGTFEVMGKDVNGIISYVDLLVSGKSKASATGGPLGNKYFLNTGASCLDDKTKKEVEAADLNKRLANEQTKAVNENQYTRYLQDQEALDQTKSAQRAQDERMNYVKVESYSPNYLKNDSGQCFPWNAMTELVYTYEDSYGFEIGRIVRRIVVNSQGYGVVYEQIIDENGQSSFTLNGQSITEALWAHDSDGSPVLVPGGPIKPPLCP